MEMFISFFSGKVMLFYGISLIMKEKSNASALRPRVDDIIKDLWNPQCSFPIIKVLFGIKAVYLRRVFKIQKNICAVLRAMIMAVAAPLPLKGAHI